MALKQVTGLGDVVTFINGNSQSCSLKKKITQKDKPLVGHNEFQYLASLTNHTKA